MSDDPRSICPTCGQPQVEAILDDVEDSFDAFFDDLDSGPIRIELDEEARDDAAQLVVPAKFVTGIEDMLGRTAQVLGVLRESFADGPEDLRALVESLVKDASHWEARLEEVRRERG